MPKYRCPNGSAKILIQDYQVGKVVRCAGRFLPDPGLPPGVHVEDYAGEAPPVQTGPVAPPPPEPPAAVTALDVGPPRPPGFRGPVGAAEGWLYFRRRGAGAGSGPRWALPTHAPGRPGAVSWCARRAGISAAPRVLPTPLLHPTGVALDLAGRPRDECPQRPAGPAGRPAAGRRGGQAPRVTSAVTSAAGCDPVLPGCHLPVSEKPGRKPRVFARVSCACTDSTTARSSPPSSKSQPDGPRRRTLRPRRAAASRSRCPARQRHLPPNMAGRPCGTSEAVRRWRPETQQFPANSHARAESRTSLSPAAWRLQ